MMKIRFSTPLVLDGRFQNRGGLVGEVATLLYIRSLDGRNDEFGVFFGFCETVTSPFDMKSLPRSSLTNAIKPLNNYPEIHLQLAAVNAQATNWINF
jgi:hypothetical protein